MREKIIIYGAGKKGVRAFECLKDSYEILFFIDRDVVKQKNGLKNLEVYPPEYLENFSEGD